MTNTDNIITNTAISIMKSNGASDVEIARLQVAMELLLLAELKERRINQ